LLTFISTILIFGLLIFFHEFGHFIVAKISGVKVEEFSIGMGPAVYSFNGSETKYSVRILPLGGYVKLFGEDEKINDIRAFNSKPVFIRSGVIIAGPLMNFVLAFLVLVIIGLVIGTPVPIIKSFVPGLPAEKSGLAIGDKIIKIDDNYINNWYELEKIISSSNGKELRFTISRNSQTMEVKIIPQYDRNANRMMIGIIPEYRKNLFDSLLFGFDQTIKMTKVIVYFFGQLFRGGASINDLTGPVGIIHIVGTVAKTGIINLLYLTAIISINLAIFNLLPFPALDGGRMVFLVYEGITRKPIDKEKEGFVHFIGFVILIIITIIITYKDLIRFSLLK